jgi:catechol 2,3-dioxygenase
MKVKELGHLVLYAKNLERSRRFYGELLDWRQVASYGRAAAFSSDRAHHELLLIQVGPDATTIPPES